MFCLVFRLLQTAETIPSMSTLQEAVAVSCLWQLLVSNICSSTEHHFHLPHYKTAASSCRKSKQYPSLSRPEQSYKELAVKCVDCISYRNTTTG